MAKKTKNPDLHDELNFARFGVISMHSRVDQGVTSWQSEFSVNDRTFRVEAITPQGRPHGIDTDTLIALETLFVMRGCPQDNWVHTTAYEVRELMGLANNGENYRRLRHSIRRLYFTSVIVGRKTSLAGRQRASWDNVGVRFLEGLRYRDREDNGDLHTLDSEATLSIRLGEQLADSIRAGVAQVLDGHLLYQLEQPPARALYRTLQAHRRQDDGSLLKTLSVPLKDWRLATGLTTDRINLVRRALSAAHDELLANNYLASVNVEGRGQAAVAHYEFMDTDGPDPALVVMLRQAGVTATRASVLASQYPERVEAALDFLAERQRVARGTVRNPGGLIADFLGHPEKYELPQEAQPDQRRKARAALSEEDRSRAEQAAQAAEEERLRALQAAPSEQQWERSRSTLHLMLRKHLSADEWRRLEMLVRRGDIDVVTLSRELVAATARTQLRERVDELRVQLLPLFNETDSD